MPENKLISYIKDYNGAIHATLVAIAPDKVGVTIRRPSDSVDKHHSVCIATGRAYLGEAPKLPNRRIMVKPSKRAKIRQVALSELVDSEFLSLRNRAEKYFVSQVK